MGTKVDGSRVGDVRLLEGSAELPAHALDCTIRAEADLVDRVPVWLDAVGAKVLINTRSTTWRGLDEAQRARAESDAAGLLIENPTLIKRPVIEQDQRTMVGWTADVQKALQG